MSAARAVPQANLTSTELAPIAENEIAEVAAFIAVQSGRSLEAIEAHLRWFLLENPAREREQPLGFALRSSAEIVGCILCSPQLFQLGQQRILMMGSSSFYVDEEYRGHGGRIFVQYSRLASRWPLFGTSANAMAASLWRAVGAIPIPHSDGEMFGVLRWSPVTEEFMYRRTSNSSLSGAAAASISGAVALFRRLKIDDSNAEALHTITCAEQAGDIVRQYPTEKLTALRDLAYVRWRYFSGKDATTRLFAFRDDASGKDILVTVNQRLRGYRQQIKTLNVLDVYPDVSPAYWLPIVGALIARFSPSVDAVVLRGINVETRNAFRKVGFQWRALEAPNGWLLDKARLPPARDWYIVPADGDGLI